MFGNKKNHPLENTGFCIAKTKIVFIYLYEHLKERIIKLEVLHVGRFKNDIAAQKINQVILFCNVMNATYFLK